MTTTTKDIQSAAELERRRLAAQAAQARASAKSQAQQARAETEAQAQEAITETGSQAQTAKAQAQREAKTRQAKIRKMRGQVEKEAQEAIGKARKARAIEQRKVVLPFTKPQNLGAVAYIANVEVVRKQAQRSGEDANAAVTKVRDDYFKEVDKARDKAVTEVQKQKAGIVADIQTQLIDYNTELNKQLAQLNSGVSVWEARSKSAIWKAQGNYEAAIKATLNRSGTDVFAEMKDKGFIPTNSIYDSYDKTTGQLNYTTPDVRSGKEIFADLQGLNKIPPNADYESYDAKTGQISYKVEIPNFGSSIFKRLQNRGEIPEDATFVSYNATDRTVTYFVSGAGTMTIPEKTGLSTSPDTSVQSIESSTTVSPSQNSTNVVGAAAGVAIVGMGTMKAVGTGLALFPEPISSIIGVILIGVATYFTARKVMEIVKSHKDTDTTTSMTDAVVANKDGTVAYSIHQFIVTPQTKGQSITGFPMEPAKAIDIKDYFPKIEPYQEKLILEQERIQPSGIPRTKEPPVVIIRDPFDVPELRAKASNILAAAAAVATVTKELPLTSEQWNRVNEAIRQGRVAEGKRIIESLADKADSPSIARSYRLAYEEYLRKRAILEAARKAYVASLNPQPIKGRGSNKATAAAIGLWLAQDIIQGEIVKALNEGDSLETAITKAQTKLKEMSQELGLTQQQIDAATATAIYQVALTNMAQEAVKAASEAQTQGLTATQIQAQTLAATKTAAKTAVQNAVNIRTLTVAQAAELARVLDQVAGYTATATAKMKLPKLPRGMKGKGGKKYPDGTIVWRMGETKKGDVYKIIPPPYTLQKPITSSYPPRGMRKTKGTPQETLTFIGGKVPFQNVSFDLGVTDGFIDVKSRKIKFTGGGQKTNVGTRIESTTKGVALVHNPPMGLRRRVKNKPLVSRGVYSDKIGSRIARRHHRGWKRIY